jgi:hypothetical protein
MVHGLRQLMEIVEKRTRTGVARGPYGAVAEYVKISQHTRLRARPRRNT